ncbi:porin [Hydrogenophaga sp.]|uniref:porin n=1 Tax=Hydrogenophaga sp. TaxID=1904254 RepID=UPI00286EAEFA|nr:porin [Hydrogenophaga sp.]
MKKTLIALAAVAATSAAFAQSSVTIDGAVDLGYVKPIGSKDARLDATNGANQIRFLGTEDLGGGLKANFALAQRFSPESGGNDGTANKRPTFQGETTVGLSGGFGSVKLGRALTAFQGPVNMTDPWGTLQVGSSAVLTTAYATDPNGNIDGSGLGRTDAIFYSSPNFSGFSFGLSLGLKTSGTANDLSADKFACVDVADASTCAAGTDGIADPDSLQAQSKGGNKKNLVSLWASYASGPLYIGGGYEQNREDDQITAIVGTYNLGFMTVGAGFSSLDPIASAKDRSSWNLMATAPMGAFLIKAGYGESKVSGDKASTKKLGLGVDYMLSKRTKVYASFGSDSVKTANKSGYDIGIRHTF